MISLPGLAQILAIDPQHPDVLDVIADMEDELEANPDHEVLFLAEREDEILEYLTTNISARREGGLSSSAVAARQIGDRHADAGWPLKERTIQTALKTLQAEGLAVSFGSDGKAYSWRLKALDPEGVGV